MGRRKERNGKKSRSEGNKEPENGKFVMDNFEIWYCGTGRQYWKPGSSMGEDHGLGRQGSWTSHFSEAKQEDCEESNERNEKCELTTGKLMYGGVYVKTRTDLHGSKLITYLITHWFFTIFDFFTKYYEKLHLPSSAKVFRKLSSKIVTTYL